MNGMAQINRLNVIAEALKKMSFSLASANARFQ
jgi:hypothetical protein